MQFSRHRLRMPTGRQSLGQHTRPTNENTKRSVIRFVDHAFIPVSVGLSSVLIVAARPALGVFWTPGVCCIHGTSPKFHFNGVILPRCCCALIGLRRGFI